MMKLTFEDNGFSQRLNSMASKVEHIPETVLSYLAKMVVESQIKTFGVGGRPVPWVPNLSGGPLLGGIGGSLAQSIHIEEIGENSFTIATASKSQLPFILIHQFGGVIRAKNVPYLKFRINGQWVQKKEVTIPARRYFRFQDEDVELLKSKLKNFVISKEGERE